MRSFQSFLAICVPTLTESALTLSLEKKGSARKTYAKRILRSSTKKSRMFEEDNTGYISTIQGRPLHVLASPNYGR